MSINPLDLVTEQRPTDPVANRKSDRKDGDRSQAFAALLRGRAETQITIAAPDTQTAIPASLRPDRGPPPHEEFAVPEPAPEEAEAKPAEENEVVEETDADADDAPADKAPESAAAPVAPVEPLPTAPVAQEGAAGTEPLDGTEAVAAAGPAATQTAGTANNQKGLENAIQRVTGDAAAARQPAVATANQQAANANQAGPEVQADLTGRDVARQAIAAKNPNVAVTKTEQAVAQPSQALSSSAAATAQAVQRPIGPDGRPTATDLFNAAQDAEAFTPSGKAKPAASQQNPRAALAQAQAAENKPGVPNANASEVAMAATQNARPPQAAPAPPPPAPLAPPPAGGLGGQPVTGGTAGATGLAGDGSTLSGMQQTSSAQQAQQRAAAQAAAAQRPALPPQIVTEQVAVNINRAMGQGLDRINIQMRPSELGRVDVRMEVAQDGRMTAVISVERQDTYDMLRSDHRSLLESLQNAGLNVDQNSLSFNLKGQSGGDVADAQNASGGSGNGSGDADDAADSGDLTADAGMLGAGEMPLPDADGRYDLRV